jgi:hypothetical protein
MPVRHIPQNAEGVRRIADPFNIDASAALRGHAEISQLHHAFLIPPTNPDHAGA